MHAIPNDPARVADPRTPIMLVVDDPAPIVHVFRCHWEDVHHRSPTTNDGRPLLDEIPNAFLSRFADVVERWGIRGKFSIVPGLGGRGDLATGINGGRLEEIREWLEILRTRLASHMDFCSEGITHNLTVDLASGRSLPIGEADWSQTQTEATLTPYLTRALGMIRDAGIDATGVTSPWVFGIKSEPHYQRAIVAAQKAVYGRDRVWYFLHMLDDKPESRPWVAINEPPTTLVSIPTTVDDYFWDTINCPRTDADYVAGIADKILTSDGSSGAILDVLAAGGWPVLLTHYQALFSNGTESGLAVLAEVAKRVDQHLSDRVIWNSASELMERTLAAG